ncbi:hypothetical protein EELLY_v1c00810 [Entomoplasma ellychniae]|uniref:Uncharacterized protein n=1 Tax=Entomoplasma ellychniae TaxID=2114 RepID=A0A8E2QVF1_9MOLU|nr:hypothetical protein [Entomoplasma ellychniae]PPE04406.1 hypothetical protein EELLY_v1c00810 [Entomoplasma ellychniae]
MLTLQQQRKRMYKVGYIFSLISIIALTFVSLIILIFAVVTLGHTAVVALGLTVLFKIIFLLVFIVLYIILFINIKRAYVQCGTDKEKDHLALGIVCVLFMTPSAIFILIATSMFHE